MEQLQTDLDNQDEEDETGLFVEGMFGGLLTIPLPIPEILSSLDKTKFKVKKAQLKKAQKGAGNEGLWR